MKKPMFFACDQLLDCYTLTPPSRVGGVGHVYACSRADYADLRSKHTDAPDLPEACPATSSSANPAPARERQRENPLAETGVCFQALKPSAAEGGRYLFVLDNAQDLWSWALLPSCLVKIAEEETFVLSGAKEDGLEDSLRHRAVLAWALASYSFEHFRTRRSSRPLQLLLKEGDRACAEEARILCYGRDLINTPANILGAERCEQEVRLVAEKSEGTFHSICGEELLASRYPLIHAVGRSAREEPRLLEVRWEAPVVKRGVKTLAIVGKGVCFDSGGLNVKDARSMRLMKKDMGGLAHALALALLLRIRQSPLCLRLLLPVAENAISRDAMRPSDIYTSRKGDTIEIGHTDAEGRLLLADTLWEASAPCSQDSIAKSQKSQKSHSALPPAATPDLVVDFATLTGAARVATGPLLPNMFTNDDTLAEGLLAASRETQDPLWRMPLWQEYRHALNCAHADLSSSGSWPYAGSITAALFLQNFVAPRMLWIHLDVMAWNERMRAGRPEGGEMQGVRALATFLDAWSRS